MKPEEISALAAAISAAATLVSLGVVAYFGWAQVHASDPKVLVTGSTSFVVAGEDVGPPFYVITVANRGVVPVTITSVGFEVSGDDSAFSLDPTDPQGRQSVPARLDPGESTSVVFDHLELGRMQRERGIRRPFALTATGERHRGKRVNGKKLASWGR
jgi:hypothetical protein